MKRLWEIIIILILSFIAIFGFAKSDNNEEEKDYLVVYHSIELKNSSISSNSAISAKIEKNYENFEITKIKTTESELEKLKKDINIKYIIPDFEVQNYADEITWSDNMVQAPLAWNNGLTGNGVKVAVLDTGIANHIDLSVTGRYDAVNAGGDANDYYGHGTSVAGIIASKSNNTGIVGIAPNVSLYAVKVMESSSSGKLSAVIDGINWCINNNIDVANLSLGINPLNLSDNDRNYVTNLLNQITINALNNGLILVAAAGNDGNSTGVDNVSFPARSTNVIGVGAIDQNRNLASFSSAGPDVDVVSPGFAVKTLGLNNTYVYGNGTSFAAPNVCGLVALYLEQYPNATPSEIISMVTSNTIDLGQPGRDNYYGNGLAIYNTSTVSYENYNPTNGIYSITNLLSKLQLDVYYASLDNGINIIQYYANNGNNQYWNIEQLADGSYRIVSIRSGKALTIAANGMVVQETWNNDISQKWNFLIGSDSSIKIINLANNKTMDIEGSSSNPIARIVVSNNSQASSQKFTIEAKNYNKQDIVGTTQDTDGKDGIYLITDPVSGKVIEVQNGSNNDGANLIINTNNNNPSQKIKLIRVSTGEYRLMSYNSGRLLSVTTADNLTNVTQWNVNISNARQLWSIEYSGQNILLRNSDTDKYMGISNNSIIQTNNAYNWNITMLEKTYYDFSEYSLYYPSNGYYTIDNNLSNLRLDVMYASMNSGAGIIQYNSNGGSNQKWYFERQGDGTFKIISANSGKVLTMDGNSVYQDNWNGSYKQKWHIYKNKYGLIKIVCVEKYYVLDIASESYNPIAQVVGFPGYYKYSQDFKITKVN